MGSKVAKGIRKGQDDKLATVRQQRKLLRGFDQNYGAMTTVMKYLHPIEQIKLQGLDKWQYDVGVSRVQVRIEWPEMFYFVDEKPSILAVSETGECQLFYCGGDSDFSNDGWLSCQVGPSRLFQCHFMDGSFRILRIDPYQRSFTVEKSQDRPEIGDVMCLTNFKDQFIFVFGMTHPPRRYSLAEDRWEQILPHKYSDPVSACSLGDKVYVFAYRNNKNWILVLHNPGASISSQELYWGQEIEVPQNQIVTPRQLVAFVPLNSTEIAILGGRASGGKSFGDVTTFNTSTCEFKKELEDKTDLFWFPKNQSAKVCENTIIAFQVFRNCQQRLIKYNKGDNGFTTSDIVIDLE